MSGIFGVVSEADCVENLFYGTDYQSHLGTERGGLAISTKTGIERKIHNIQEEQFRAKFKDFVQAVQGNSGIGIISDYEDQPLIINSHLGRYAIVSVSKINNIDNLVLRSFGNGRHFIEMSGGKVNPTELIASMIDQKKSFEEGIENAQINIDGSCTLAILTENGIYAARDKFGRTPLIVGKKPGSYAITSETCALPNTYFKVIKELGPGEIVLMTREGIEQRKPAENNLQICSFLWVYYGNPASNYEGRNVQIVRGNCGRALAKRDNVEVDSVCGIPDSGIGHATGYANESKIDISHPLSKYGQTYQRSFMPQNQAQRDLVAKMKIIPISELISGKRLLFCDDSVVRGTQLREKVHLLFDYGAKEAHMRIACPPLVHGCKFLGFSRSKSESELAARRAINFLEGKEDVSQEVLREYSNPDSEKYLAMVEVIRKEMGATTLMYQRLDDLVKAIGLPKESLCTYCWDGERKK